MLPEQEGVTSTPPNLIFTTRFWCTVPSTVPFVRLLYGDGLQQLECTRGKVSTDKGVRAKG